MILAQNFIDMLADEKATLTGMQYFLNSNPYNAGTVATNFKNDKVAWTDVMYIWDYDARLHFRVKDTRAYLYNCLFVRSMWERYEIETKVPFCVVQDIHNINSLKDSMYDGVENWFVLDLSSYDIRCKINYSPVNFLVNSKDNIHHRHWHKTGLDTEGWVIRDVSSIFEYKDNVKCLMSRGNRSCPSGWKEW